MAQEFTQRRRFTLPEEERQLRLCRLNARLGKTQGWIELGQQATARLLGRFTDDPSPAFEFMSIGAITGEGTGEGDRNEAHSPKFYTLLKRPLEALSTN
jgi:hypothetical protein